MAGTYKRTRTLTNAADVNRLFEGIDMAKLDPIIIGVNHKYKSLKEWKLKNEYLGYWAHCVIEEKETHIEVTTRFCPEDWDLFGTVCTYKFSLNEDIEISVTGQQAYSELQKYYKLVKADEYYIYNEGLKEHFYDDEKNKYLCSAKPLLSYNEKYNK